MTCPECNGTGALPYSACCYSRIIEGNCACCEKPAKGENCTRCRSTGQIDRAQEIKDEKADHDRDSLIDNLEPHDGPTDFNQL